MENQIKTKLEIKCRFKIVLLNQNVDWKTISKEYNLHDNGVEQILKENELNLVHVSIRHRKESGLIVANFVIRDISQNLNDVHNAKINIEKAAEILESILPKEIVCTYI